MELLRCSAGFFFGKTMGCVLVSILTFSLSLSFLFFLWLFTMRQSKSSTWEIRNWEKKIKVTV